MKKKRRNPRPERSAFESARAALERAGEEYPPATEEDAPGTPEPSEASEAPETLDTPAFATVEDMEEPEAVEDADGVEAETPETADSADAEAVEGTDNADAETPEDTDSADAETVENTDAADAEAVESTDNGEPDAAENMDGTEAEAVENTNNAEPDTVEPDAVEAQPPESADAVETETPGNPEQAAAFVQPDIVAEEAPDANAAFSEEPAAAPSDGPEAVEDVEDADAESAWDVDYEPFPGMESEVTDTERHTMETREITLGYKGPDADKPESDEAESGKKSEKRGKKPRFNPLERLKAAVQEYASREKSNQEPDDVPPSAVSKDAVIRKRVMQIEDEDTRNYLLDRVLPQMTWYGRKSAQYQKMYYRFMVATIVLGALIPISALLAHLIVAALLGASVTAINAYLALRKYQELWVSYRNIREDLLHTLYCYFNRAGVFAKKDSTQEELNVLLVDTCENAFSKENGGWSTTMQKAL